MNIRERFEFECVESLNRLVSLSELQDGWDCGEGFALCSESLDCFERFVNSYWNEKVPEDVSLFLTSSGNLEIQWDEGNLEIDFEFFDNHIEYFILMEGVFEIEGTISY